MNPVKVYTDALKKSFDYRGKATREEYWMFLAAAFTISVILVGLAVGVVILLIGSAAVFDGLSSDAYDTETKIFLIVLLAVWLIVLLSVVGLPWCSLMTRRVNDMGWSRWCLMVFVITPYVPKWISPVLMIFFGLIPSKKQENDPSANEL
ncbi:MAG: DUF805 domain-containing protein [Verrucomicrobia bacterium]|nr:DUF805 domain-containing protein [Verrucomicrobiota bacterium]MBR5978744.1 DUF805 domain-containing protein [Verrucomicrobiota bacterium]